jgi:hypothetical protein
LPFTTRLFSSLSFILIFRHASAVRTNNNPSQFAHSLSLGAVINNFQGAHAPQINFTKIKLWLRPTRKQRRRGEKCQRSAFAAQICQLSSRLARQMPEQRLGTFAQQDPAKI